jgi:hypothetical protein
MKFYTSRGHGCGIYSELFFINSNDYMGTGGRASRINYRDAKKHIAGYFRSGSISSISVGNTIIRKVNQQKTENKTHGV